MPLIIYSQDGSSSGEGTSFPNEATLLKLGTNSEGNLTFNGKIVNANPLEVPLEVILTPEIISKKCIELPDDCDTSQIITLSIQGILTQRNNDWEVIAKDWPDKDLITWNGLGLDTLARVGDLISISYYKK